MVPQDLMRKYKYGYVHSCELLNEPFIKDLVKKNQELEKRLDEEKMSHEFDERIIEQHCDFVDEHYRQQQEFIKYLEESQFIPNMTGEDYEEDYTITKVLQKYKEIIGKDINVLSKEGNEVE